RTTARAAAGVIATRRIEEDGLSGTKPYRACEGRVNAFGPTRRRARLFQVEPVAALDARCVKAGEEIEARLRLEHGWRHRRRRREFFDKERRGRCGACNERIVV